METKSINRHAAAEKTHQASLLAIETELPLLAEAVENAATRLVQSESLVHQAKSQRASLATVGNMSAITVEGVAEHWNNIQNLCDQHVTSETTKMESMRNEVEKAKADEDTEKREVIRLGGEILEAGRRAYKARERKDVLEGVLQGVEGSIEMVEVVEKRMREVIRHADRGEVEHDENDIGSKSLLSSPGLGPVT
jgi:uncharacterized protein (DUF2235 family)